MNLIEEKIVAQDPNWCQIGPGEFTTVINGYGFVIFQYDSKMWLCGLSKHTVKWQQKVHHTTGSKIIGFWLGHREHTPMMFLLPASANFVSRVVINAHPDMFCKNVMPIVPDDWRSAARKKGWL